MSGNSRPRKIRYLTAFMCISLLGSLSGNSILISDAEAETTVEKMQLRLTSLEKLEVVESKLDASIDKNVPVGTIMPFGGSVEEIEKLKAKGWLLCDGAKLERRQYEELYNAIGFAFGKPDENSFNLPDLRGRFVRGVDHGAGRDPDAKERTNEKPGGNKEDNVGSVQEDNLVEHQHSITWPESVFMTSIKAGTYSGGRHGKYVDVPKHTDLTGGKETRPKNIYVNWIIKAE